jgi:acetyl-CoA acyltransferase
MTRSDVLVAGVGMTPFGKFADRGLKALAGEAVAAALLDSGIDGCDLQYAAVGNAVAGLITGQECIRGQVMLRAAGVGEIPIVNVENACASGATALYVAWQAIRAGTADVALALGAEKLTHEDKARSLAAFSAAVDVEQAVQGDEREPWSKSLASHRNPKRSMFMDIYAAAIRAHMRRYGTTKEQLARVAVKSHRFGSLNPLAQYRRQVTIEEVLGDVVVADPLTRMMCSPIGDGAAAAVLVSAGFARRQGLIDRPKIVACASTSGNFPDGEGPSAEQRAIALAYEQAGLGPEDLDVVEVHDATCPAELLAYEDLGLCAEGDSGRVIDDGHTDLGGRCPVNTSGGLVARGHPVGATGLAQICELSWQLRGLASSRQVSDPQVALAQNGGGSLGNDSAAQVVTVLVR